MSREELINLVKIIMAGGEDENTGKSYTESELDKLVVLFEKSIPNKNGSDLKMCIRDRAYILLERGMEIFMMKQLNLQVHLKSFLLRG